MNMKGSLPLLVLYILSDGSKHGYEISKTIKQKSEGVLDFAEGTLYPTLHDLEKRGYIQAFEEQVKGRTRRCYRLTESGSAAMAEERHAWERYASGVNLVLGGA